MNETDLARYVRHIAARPPSLCAATLQWGRHGSHSLLSTYALWRCAVALRAYERPIGLGDLAGLIGTDEDAMVRFALACEYGHVLDALADSVFTIRRVAVAQLRCDSGCHQPDGHADWQPDMPAALVRAGTHVIDGYHRVAEARTQRLGDVLVVAAG